jgi:hypothetical protein
MRTARSLVALLLVPVCLGGCASGGAGGGGQGPGGERGGMPELEGGVEMGLRRGATWTTATVKPPYVIGPRMNLHLNHDVFGGAIDGMPVKLRVEPDGISGNGPVGPVSMDIEPATDKLVIEGTWNGSRAHFEITDQVFKGSLAVYRGRQVESEVYCQYVLDRVEADGARSGTSICSGLPEQTRLEVPAQVQKWLTRQELVVVLLALLSSPPITQLERQQP